MPLASTETDPVRNFALFCCFLQQLERRHLARDIVVQMGRLPPERDPRPVVKLNSRRFAGFLLDLDLRQSRNEAHIVQRLLVLLAESQLLVEPSKSLNVTHGLMMSSTDVPLCLSAALMSGTICFFCCRESHPATNVAPPMIASVHRSNGATSLASPCGLEVLVELAVAKNCPFVRP